MTILQAATTFLYYYDTNPPAYMINTVGNAIRTGLKNRKFSGLFCQSLAKCSADASKFLNSL
jgi:hypothetical protein